MIKPRSRDLTQGNIALQILGLALPLLLAQIFQNLYNSVDSIIVGNFVGTTALAAVSASSDIAHLLIGFFSGLSVGFSVLFSQYYGGRNFVKLHDAIHSAMLFAILLGATLAITGILITPILLELVKCPPDVYPEAFLYLRVYFIGVFFTSVFNVSSGVLRAVGDSKSSLYYLAVACGINIVLDILFVTKLDLGVRGVAFATIISQFVAVCLVLRNLMTTEDVFVLVPKELTFKKGILNKVMRLGVPAAIQNCMISFSNLFIQRYINSFGASAMAGIGAAKKVDKYIGLVAIALGMATATYIGQNVGARKFERVRKGIHHTITISFIFITLLGLPTYFFASSLIRVFTSETEAIQYGTEMIRTIVPLYYAQALHQIFSNTVRGYGYSSMAMITTIGGMIIFRQIFLITSMAADYNVHNIYLSFPIGWISSAILAFVFFVLVVRKKNNVLISKEIGTLEEYN